MSVTAPVMSAHERVALVADPGSLEAWDEHIVSADPLRFADTRPYTERLAGAREATGLSEAVLTGEVAIAGRPLVVVAGEFGFLGAASAPPPASASRAQSSAPASGACRSSP